MHPWFERYFVPAFLILVAVFTAGDLVEDRLEGVGWTHLVSEGIILTLAVVTASVVVSKELRALERSKRRLENEVAEARAEAARWQQESNELLSGLGAAIAEQFGRWGLSPAEAEVALFLIKGLSSKEIATFRGTTEKTVRIQASSVYQKAGLEGRAELAAFFLEHLELPSSYAQK